MDAIAVAWVEVVMPEIAEDLITEIVDNDQGVHIQPLNDADLERESEFVNRVTPGGPYVRFLAEADAGQESLQVDFDTKMAFIATLKHSDPENEVIGVTRYRTDEFDHCEFVITVADEWQEHDVGRQLVKSLIDFAKDKDKKFIYAIDHIDNMLMRRIAQDLDLDVQRDTYDASTLRFELLL